MRLGMYEFFFGLVFAFFSLAASARGIPLLLENPEFKEIATSLSVSFTTLLAIAIITVLGGLFGKWLGNALATKRTGSKKQ